MVDAIPATTRRSPLESDELSLQSWQIEQLCAL
jgi:hypothetical protein